MVETISRRVCTFLLTVTSAVAWAQMGTSADPLAPSSITVPTISNSTGRETPAAPSGVTPARREIPGLPSIGNTTGREEIPPSSAAERSSRTDRQRGMPRPAELNRFQRFLLDTTGIILPLFGTRLFEDTPSTFSPLDSVPVTADYLVGPGDELLIRGWGAVEIDYRAVVDRTGAIRIPRVGVVQVAGVRYQDLPDHIRRAVGRVFRNFELTVSLGQLRAIQIYVVGQALKPGSYTVSSLSTLVNAVFAAGGPGPAGSMRRVELKRGGRTITQFDLYDLLTKGDKSADAQLLPGDVIFFPPVGALAAVSGSVNTPGIYELKPQETLGDALRFAGGLSSEAEGRRVTVDRIEGRQVRKVDEFDLDPAGLAKPLRDGDVVNVFGIVPRFDNSVSLRGNVAQPLHLPFRQGMRVRDLIPDRAALLSREYWTERYRLPDSDGSVLPLREDGAVGKTRQGQRQGQRPAGRFQSDVTSQDRRTATDVRPPDGEVNWEYAVIERLDRGDYSTRLIPFNLGMAVLEGSDAQNLLLEPGDVVLIFSKNDVRVPLGKQTRYVRLEGEVAQAGVFQVLPGETLRQVVMRAGGLTASAYLFGAELTRESTRKMQQEKLDAAADRLEREAQRLVSSRAQNALAPADAAAAATELEAQRALIARLRTMKAPGRIVLEVPPAANHIKDLPDVPLEDGDQFYVPPASSTVSVFGAVYNQNSFLHRPGKSVDDYLRQAGGPTKDADDGEMYVLRADGSVVSRKQGGTFSGGRLSSLRLMPNDAVVVPEKLDRTEFRRLLRDWTQIFAQFGVGIAALRVLKGL
jgi:polysaccharide export outer membrane protein